MTLHRRLARVEGVAGAIPPPAAPAPELSPEHMRAVTAALVASGHLVVVGGDEDGEEGELALPDGRLLRDLPPDMTVQDIIADDGTREFAKGMVAAHTALPY